MAPPANEFVFFKVRPDIKPEAPESNQDSDNLLNLLRDTKEQHGYQASAWGRSVEDEDVIVWAVDWSDIRDASRATLLAPYLAPNTEVLTMYTTLTPPLTISTLCSNPVTEFGPLTFPTSLTPEEHKDLDNALIQLRTDTMDVPDGSETKPRHWSMGHVDRPGVQGHPSSATGEAFMMILIIGWESVDAHKKSRELAPFKRNVGPIAEKMLPTGPELLPGREWGMSHVRFREI